MCYANSEAEELELLSTRLTNAATMVRSALERARFELTMVEQELKDMSKEVRGDSNN